MSDAFQMVTERTGSAWGSRRVLSESHGVRGAQDTLGGNRHSGVQVKDWPQSSGAQAGVTFAARAGPATRSCRVCSKSPGSKTFERFTMGTGSAWLPHP